MKNPKKFNMRLKTKKPYFFLMPIEWIIAWFMAGPFGKKTKIIKHNMENVKGPYLIFSNHASEIDFSNMALATFPRSCCWVCSIEEFVGREWLMRGIGCIPKRKYTKDIALIKECARVVQKLKRNLVIYPEARYTPCGVNEHTGEALGKFAKLIKAPVLVANQKGNYLHQPCFEKKPKRKNPCQMDLICVATKEEVETLSQEELQARIEKAFAYDDYLWQYENDIHIKLKTRARNLQNILYKCPVCGGEHMLGSGTTLECLDCKAKWEMDELSRMHLLTKNVTWDESLTHIPTWYAWERAQVNEEVKNGKYFFKDTVRVDKLINGHVGFKKIGYVDMTQDERGIILDGTLDNGEHFHFERLPQATSSIHVEYNFKKKGTFKRGPALDIADLDESYFVFPENKGHLLTKIHFATEALFDKATSKEHK